jgi:hypothetical protein
MFNGQDLAGWKGSKDDWKVVDGVVHAANKSLLVSELDQLTNCKLIFDWKLPAKSMSSCRVENRHAGPDSRCDLRPGE